MHITTNKTLGKLLAPVVTLCGLFGSAFPVATVRIRYFLRFKRLPDLKNPQDLNEKILYLKLFSDTDTWGELADKYKVRAYVERCGLSDILIPLYGVWSRAEDFRLERMPASFALKANNGDGKDCNLLVRDKSRYTEEQLRGIMAGWLGRKRVGALSAEPQYRKIVPAVTAEELLPADGGEPSLVDYKIWCFNGKPYSILTCSNRSGAKAHLGCYDLDWKHHPENMAALRCYPQRERPLPRPACLDRMLEIAERLSKPFPQVRVDLYEAKGKVYFGELTFTSLGGMMNYYTPAYLLEMGRQVDLRYRGE